MSPHFSLGVASYLSMCWLALLSFFFAASNVARNEAKRSGGKATARRVGRGADGMGWDGMG